MGLDMYLMKETYVKNWNHQSPEERHEVTVKRGGKVRPDIKPERVSRVVEQVAYWRKANAIHQWFVDNVQDGVDDCRRSYVDREDLRNLVDLCKKVLDSIETVEGEVTTGRRYYPDGRIVEETKPGQVVAQRSIAEGLLPTQEGFFFGGTEYDEYYIEHVKETVEMLEPLLEEEGDGDFYYRASW